MADIFDQIAPDKNGKDIFDQIAPEPDVFDQVADRPARDVGLPRYDPIRDQLTGFGAASVPGMELASSFYRGKQPPAKVVPDRPESEPVPGEPKRELAPDEDKTRGRIGELAAASARGWLNMGEKFIAASQKFSPLWGKYGAAGVYRLHTANEEDMKRALATAGGDKKKAAELLASGEVLTTARQKIKSAASKFPKTREGLSGWAWNVLGEGAPILVTSIAAGSTIGQAGPFMNMFINAGESAYAEAKERGASEAVALRDYVLTGLPEAALEMWGVNRLLNFKAAGKGSLKALINNVRKGLWKQAGGNVKNITGNMLKSAVVEGLEEVSQGGARLAVATLPGGIDIPRKKDGSPDYRTMIEQTLEEGAAGALLGGLVPMGMNVPSGAVEAARPSVQNIEAVAEQVWTDDRLTDIEKGRTLTELKELLPKDYQAQPAEAAEAGSVFDVPESTQRKLDALNRFESNLIEYETQRAKLEKETKKRRGSRFAKFKESLFRSKEKGIDADEAMARASSAMKGFTRQIFPEFEQTFPQHEMKMLQQSVVEATLNDRLPPAQSMKISNVFNALVNNVVPSRSELQAFDNFFGTHIVEAARNVPQTKLQKVWRVLRGLSQTYKSIKASCEHSYALVQGFPFALAYPVRWTKAVARSHRAMLSGDYIRLRQIQRRMNPHYHHVMAASNGKYFSEAGTTHSEEEFANSYVHKIPIFKYLAKASERAHVEGLNGMRDLVFDVLDNLGSETPFVKKQELVHHLSNLTGRGYGDPKGYFEKHMDVWSDALWTPRMLRADIAAPFDVFTKPHIRKIAAYNLVKSAAMLAALTALIGGIPGVDVDDDPRSSTFGRGKVGNRFFNMWPRAAKYVRVVAQIASQEKTNIRTGEPFYKEWEETLAQFLRGKLNPTLGVGVDLLTGKTFEGKPIYPELDSLSEYALRQASPLFIKDIYEAVKFQGMGHPMPLLALGGYLGADMLTLENNATAMADKIKSKYAHEYFGKEWWELGKEAQAEIYNREPLIEQYEADARRERTDYTWWGKIKQREHDMGEKVVKKLPSSLQRMYEESGAAIVPLEQGLGYNGRYWRMNLRRYEEYQRKSTEYLKKGLSVLRAQVPDFKSYPAAAQQQMLEDLAKDALKAARVEIVDKITKDDMESYERTKDERATAE